MINTPVYPPFFAVIEETGRRAVEVPLLGAEHGRRLPLDGIRAAFAAGAQALLLCNPHNPTGYVAGHEELMEVARIAAEHDGVVLADEIHAPLTLPGATHVPFCSLPDAVTERAITLTSASKAWNLAGLKCGIAVAALGPHGEPRSAASRPSCPSGRPPRRARVRDGLRRGRRVARRAARLPRRDPPRAAGRLAERLPGVGYEPGRATYLAWLDFRAVGLGDDPAAALLEHGRVALSPGLEFGAPGRGHARLNLGTSRALVAEAVDRIAHAVGVATGPGAPATAAK